MWRLFIAEVEYRKLTCIIMFFFTPLIALYSRWQWHSVTAAYVLFWAVLIALQNSVILRNRDNRERMFSLLPLAHWRCGVYRSSSIAIQAALFTGLFALVRAIVHPQAQMHAKHLLTLILAIWVIFSVYYAGRDAFLDFFRRIGITRERFLLIAVLMGIVLQILGLVAFLRASSGKATQIFFLRWIDWAIHDHPFQGDIGYLRFIGIVLLFAILSVWTFVRRRSYVK
ncbi:hypothetical protein JXO59_09490 [candidate division KSB1 bacterium]|nr:hypothetical protein [candidate division KSB1 bacterium]